MVCVLVDGSGGISGRGQRGLQGRAFLDLESAEWGTGSGHKH